MKSVDAEVKSTKVGKLSKLLKEIQGLDIENYGNWSKPIQVTSWVFAGVAAAIIGFFVTSNSIITLTENEIENRTASVGEYEAKYSKYSGATKYKEQLVEIEQRFNEQLQQLPKETEIPGLVDDLNRAGKQAGLKIESLQLGAEVKKEFFIEQPIEIEASGDFHAFGQFVSLVSGLPRIVTIQTFNASVGKDEVRIPETSYTIKASTYRYLDKQADPAARAQ